MICNMPLDYLQSCLEGASGLMLDMPGRRGLTVNFWSGCGLMITTLSLTVVAVGTEEHPIINDTASNKIYFTEYLPR